MAAHDELQQALRKLKLRLSAGEIDEATYQRQRELILSDLTPEERVALATGTPSPQPVTPPPPTPPAITPSSLGPSGAPGRGVRTSIPSLADLDLRPGTVLLGQWKLVRELGKGGFGAVFEAEELHLGERQAVKVLDPAMVAKAELLARFRREVSLMRKLVHPRIVRVYDYREDLEQLVALISMELVGGGSVKQLLATARAQGGEIPIPLALEILGQTLEALAEAHGQGVIHRDVTPGNVLLAGGRPEQLLADPARNPQVKLVDFGIAGLVERSELSQKSRVLGTAAYVAPEVLDPAVEVSPAADVYGAGAMGYELLTGKLPLGRFTEPGQLRAGLPVPINAFVLALLEAEPTRRPHAAESARELPRILEDLTRQAAARREAEERARREAELARHRAEQERLRRAAEGERAREESRRQEAAARERERKEAESRGMEEWARQQEAARQEEERQRQEAERERQRQAAIRRVKAEPATYARPEARKKGLSNGAWLGIAAALLAVVIGVGWWGISSQRAAQGRARAEAARLEQEKRAAVAAERQREEQAAAQGRERQARLLEEERQKAAREEGARIAKEQEEAKATEAAVKRRREAEAATQRQREAEVAAQRQREAEAVELRQRELEARKQTGLGAGLPERAVQAQAVAGVGAEGAAEVWQDATTGLLWAMDPSSPRRGLVHGNWETADQFCKNLSRAGFSDWRLPTLSEAKAFRDSPGNPLPSSQGWSKGGFVVIWTSTLTRIRDRAAWQVHTYSGGTQEEWNRESGVAYGLCVRGSR